MSIAAQVIPADINAMVDIYMPLIEQVGVLCLIAAAAIALLKWLRPALFNKTEERFRSFQGDLAADRAYKKDRANSYYERRRYAREKWKRNNRDKW